MKNKRNCLTCKKDSPFFKCNILKNNEEYQSILKSVLSKGEVNEGDEEYSNEAYEFKEKFICDNFKSRYIEYPIEVSKINQDKDMSSYKDEYKGRFVKIRPCGDKYENKTYLGIYLGELPRGNRIVYNHDTKELDVSFDNNPAIFVFDLKEIIYGCESWWGFIKDENDLKNIADIDIENVWYVKALKGLEKISN